MRFLHRDAIEADLPRIVEIYNFAVATRASSCDLEPTTVDRYASFAEVLTATLFALNKASARLFKKFSFERWGYMPRVARLEGVELDLELVGRRLGRTV